MPTFILGAGFNADAAAEAARHENEYYYPLVGDTLRLCFNLLEVPAGKSIEDLFSEALESRNYEPIRKLAGRLRRADYYVAHALASAKRANVYQKFFRTFRRSSFLTFNYDSLAETFLYREGCWYPRDGYGVPVVAHLPPGTEKLAGKKSSAFVLHLHGSLCIRTSEFEARRKPGESMALLTPRDEPRYAFDASSISANFAPFHREAGADDMENRIIAPVLDKTEGLKQAFIHHSYARAISTLRHSDIVVSIGYSFSDHDRASYRSLLEAGCESESRKLIVVSPDAGTVAPALRLAFPNLSVKPVIASFKQWVANSFPGLG